MLYVAVGAVSAVFALMVVRGLARPRR